MFLTQEHPSAFISVEGNLARESGFEESFQQNFAVFQEIKNVLEDYPEHPYQDAFSIAELHQKLVSHVLRYLPKCQSVLGSEEELSKDAKLPYRSKQERIRLDTLIRGNILHLLRENADWVGRRLQRSDSSEQ